jgi:hypothetical protein
MTATAAPDWFVAALDALRAGDVDGFMAMYGEEAIQELPFAPEGGLRRLEGSCRFAGPRDRGRALGLTVVSRSRVMCQTYCLKRGVEVSGHGTLSLTDDHETVRASRDELPSFEAFRPSSYRLLEHGVLGSAARAMQVQRNQVLSHRRGRCRRDVIPGRPERETAPTAPQHARCVDHGSAVATVQPRQSDRAAARS